MKTFIFHREKVSLSIIFIYLFIYFSPLTAGDEGSSSGSGSGCSDGCTTEFVYIGTEAPVIGVDRSDERAAVAAGKSLVCGPSPLLVAMALALSLAALQTQRR